MKTYNMSMMYMDGRERKCQVQCSNNKEVIALARYLIVKDSGILFCIVEDTEDNSIITYVV